MNISNLLQNPFNIIWLVIGLAIFGFIISFSLSKILPIFIDKKYRSDSKLWFKKNWKWFIPVAFCAIIGINLAIITSMKSSEIYKTSIIILKDNEEIRKILGSPISEGYFVKGEISSNGGHIYYSVEGTKNSGSLVADAKVENGKLKMNYIYIILKSGEKISILEK